jgi:hypothetical protein
MCLFRQNKIPDPKNPPRGRIISAVYSQPIRSQYADHSKSKGKEHCR